MSRPNFLLIALFALAWPLGSLAQRSGIGVKGGILGSLTRSALVRYQPVPGGTLGFYAPLHGGSRFELQPELLITLQGSTHMDTENDLRRSDRLLYLHLPISTKFFLSNTFNLQAGGQVGWLLLARTTTSDGTRDSRSDFTPMDAGLVVGIGVDLRSGTDLALRYYNGLVPVLMADSTVFPHNNTLQFTLGYRFIRFGAIDRGRRRS
mgnify:CR=1 FL=1